MSSPALNALILAAGKGTRMKSNLAKVLHQVHFKPMLHHVLDAVAFLAFEKIIVVTGHQADAVRSACSGYDKLQFVLQEQQLGTGHAVLAAESVLADSGGVVMILCGDTPLIRSETLQAMLDQHQQSQAVLTVMTTVVDDPTHYGRIIEDEQGGIVAIVEEKDASFEQRRITKINAGIYCVDVDFLLKALKGVDSNNKQGEIYLTDIVGKAHAQGRIVNGYLCPASRETLGVNSRMEMAQANEVLQTRFNDKLMASGVTLTQPATVSIASEVVIGRDTVVEPGAYLSGATSVGENCRIGHCCFLVNSRVGNNVTFGPGCYVDGCEVSDNTVIPPHSRLAEGDSP